MRDDRSDTRRAAAARDPVRAAGGVAVAIVGGLAVSVFLAGCRGEAPADGADGGTSAPGADGTGAGRSVVAVSVPPLAWFVDRLAGDRAEVVVMVPPGASPATHEPTGRQMRAVSRADLYVAVGHPAFPFESAWMDALTDVNPGMRVVPAGEGCDVLAGDPHVWLSTACAGRMTGDVAAALAEALEEPPPDLEERSRAVSAAVDSVAAGMARRLEAHRGAAFLVYHPSLGYVAREFGLRQLAIARGPSGPGAAGLGEIIRTAREAGIHTVLVQPQFSQEAARTVAAELDGGRIAAVDPLARDWPAGMLEIARRISASLERPTATGPAAESGAVFGTARGPRAARR